MSIEMLCYIESGFASRSLEHIALTNVPIRNLELELGKTGSCHAHVRHGASLRRKREKCNAFKERENYPLPRLRGSIQSTTCQSLNQLPHKIKEEKEEKKEKDPRKPKKRVYLNYQIGSYPSNLGSNSTPSKGNLGHERRARPKRKGALSGPLQGLRLELEIKVPKNLGEDKTHFRIC